VEAPTSAFWAKELRDLDRDFGDKGNGVVLVSIRRKRPNTAFLGKTLKELLTRHSSAVYQQITFESSHLEHTEYTRKPTR
jgi:hypothetical protein